MRVALTGTPGTGKTTAADLVETDLRVVHLNEAIEAEGLYAEVDEDRDSVVADVEAVEEYVDSLGDGVLVDSHLAHLLPADLVVVLRCRPDALASRLEERGEPERKARENAESEALDVVLSEAVRRHGEEWVYEIETTERDPGAVAAEIEAVLAGERDPSAGTVDYTGYL